MAPTPGRGARLLGGVLGGYGALSLLSGLLARALGTFAEAPLPGGAFRGAVLGICLIAAAGALGFALRGGRAGRFGASLLAGAIGVALAGWGLGLPALLPAALETAGGAALLVALARALEPAPRADAPLATDKARLVRAEGRTASVALEALGPEDRVRVAAGRAVPADGALGASSARVDGSALGLPADREVGFGDPVFAGEIASEEVDVDVLRAPRDALLVELRRWRASVGAALAQPARREVGLGGVVVVVAAVGFALRLVYGPDASPARLAAELGGLALAACVGLPALVGARRRRGALERLAGAGVVLTRAPDLARILSAQRYQVDPRLLLGPGAVEVVALDDTPKAHLLAVGAALLEGREGFEGRALARAARARGAPELRGAGLGARGDLVMGTVRGARWHIGPRAAMASSGVRLPRSLEGTLGFLADRGYRVLLLGAPDRGVVAAFGLEIAAEPEVRAAARALGAGLAPDLDAAVLRPLAHAAGLEVHDRRGGPSTCVLLHPDAPPPESGLGVRVLPPLVGLEFSEGPPRVWAPSLGALAPALEDAGRLVRGAPRRAAAALAPPAAASGLLYLGAFVPAVGVALALAAVAWATRGPPRASVDAASNAEDPAIDVTLSGIEVAEPERKGGSEV